MAKGMLEPGVVLQETYRILHPLAAGGMGELYVAAHERLPGRFAIKVLNRDCRDDEALSRFRCEAEIMAGLRHPHVVQVVDFNVTEDGSPYLVMELVEGKDLAEYLKDGQPLQPLRVSSIVRQIASALEAAHARGVVHRDLKPENVMIVSLDDQEEFVKVVDFGISKTNWSQRITADSTILGTPQFMAPEQAQGRREEVDHRTDQFALAAMTYTLLTGREPFRGETAVTVLYQVVHQDPEPLQSCVQWRCARTNEVLRRGMAKDRDARFGSVIEFAKALDEAMSLDLELPLTKTPSARLTLIAAGADLARARTQASTLATIRVGGRARRATRRVVAAGAASAAVVVAVMLYLGTYGWGRPAVGAAPLGPRGHDSSRALGALALPDAGPSIGCVQDLAVVPPEVLGGATLAHPARATSAGQP